MERVSDSSFAIKVFTRPASPFLNPGNFREYDQHLNRAHMTRCKALAYQFGKSPAMIGRLISAPFVLFLQDCADASLAVLVSPP